jgi:hypothetical protein
MGLIPNKKNKKDKRASGTAAKGTGFPVPKGKTNTKGAMKNTRLTGGSQRGS